jgi:signal transduction histidine kinase/PAS domain-containing protein
MAGRVRSHDWSKTPLGPLGQWPLSLRTAAGICLDSRFPMFVWWGPELINIYNDAYVPMLGKRHPDALGRRAARIWSEIWPVLGPQAEAVMQRGEATWNERVLLMMERKGFTEETYFTWSYSPILDESGGIGGLFCACTEETAMVLAERERDRLLLQVESERARLSDAFAQSPSFLAILRGPQHVFEFANERYYQLAGHRNLIGKPVRHAVPEVEGQGFFEMLDRVYATGEPFVGTGLPIMFQRQPGRALERAYVSFVFQPMRDADRVITGILVHGVDITDRKRAEDAINSEKQVLEKIATGSPLPDVLDTIVRSVEAQTLDGMLCSILILDEAGERLLHGAAPSLPDAYNAAIHNAPIGPAVGSCGTAVFERRMVFATDIAHDPRWKDFRGIAAEHSLGACCSTPIIASDGRVLGTVAMYYREPHEPSEHDIELTRLATHLAGIVIERQQVDARLRHSLQAEQSARSQAEQASRMKDEFLATLSHELRTPLNAILGWSKMLQREAVTAKDLARGAEVIERNARAQAKIIEDLLDMSAIISGKVRLDVERLDLAAIARSAVETAMPAADAKHIRLSSEVEPLRGAQVNGDPNRMQQVLWNLISNAIKFTPREGRVEVRLRRVGPQVEISVTDTGEGIDPRFLPFVFDRFRQADASTTRRYGGLGLGLSIVKQLVELHGGSVSVESDGLGRGARFIVALPVSAASRDLEAGSASPPPALAGAAHQPGDYPDDITGMRVLVVDDDSDARDLVKRVLEDREVSVTTAASSAEAMTLVKHGQFDLLVSDIGMPGEDGHALIRQLRSLAPGMGGDIPAVALTAYARPEDRAKALGAGYQMHAAKPIEPAELIAIVASLARRA